MDRLARQSRVIPHQVKYLNEGCLSILSAANYFCLMHFRPSYVALFLALFCCPDRAENAEISVPFSSEFSRRALFAGPLLAYSARDAYIDFSDIQKSIPVDRSGLLALGLAGGIQVPVSRIVRLQIGLCIDIGSATDDTLFTAETVSVRNYYYHAGLEPQVHIALWQSGKFAPFILAGAGINGVWVQERTFLLNKPAQEILYTDRRYVSDISVSFTVSAGAGFDVAVNNRVGIFVTDYFRYLYPVSYKINQDLPLYDLAYHEAQYGNVLCAGISMKLR